LSSSENDPWVAKAAEILARERLSIARNAKWLARELRAAHDEGENEGRGNPPVKW
jgi:hypothetical protein